MRTRKDCKPNLTISKIQCLLKELDLSVNEELFITNKNIVSVRLTIKPFYDLGTNGKGTSVEFARASAYGELMERLQSGFLFKDFFLIKKVFKSINIVNSKYNTDYFFRKFYKDDSNIQNIIQLYNRDNKYCDCIFSDNLIDKKKYIIPIRIINTICHSNGLCAGNSKEEALVQGICEIFERYCLRKIIQEEKELPTINYKNDIIRLIEKEGFYCQIKDCSFDILPVVGILLYDKNHEKYLFTIASDVDFEIAIQRCLTEMFQGNTLDTINNKMKKINSSELNNKYLNFLKFYSSNDGTLFNNFFITNKESQCIPKVFKKNLNNKEALSYLLGLCASLNYNVFLIDYSFMGFNTYRILIPGISEIEWPSIDEINCLIDYNGISKILLSYKRFFSSFKRKLLNKLLLLYNLDKYRFVTPSNFFHTEHFVRSDLDKLSFVQLICIFLIKTNNIKTLNEICIEEQEKARLKEEKEFFNKLIVDKKFRNKIKKMKLKLPLCPFCFICKCRCECTYKIWNKLQKKMKRREQNEL